MHEKKLFIIYMVSFFAVITAFFWIRLIFSRSKKEFKILSITTIIIAIIYLLYFNTRNNINRHLQHYIEKPIVLNSYYGKKNAILKMHKNFRYSIIYNDTIIKEGKWDVHAPSYSPVTIDGQILGFDELKLSKKIIN